MTARADGPQPAPDPPGPDPPAPGPPAAQHDPRVGVSASASRGFRATVADPAEVRAAKDALRRRITAARRAQEPALRAARAAALATAAVRLAVGVVGPVCAYAPIGSEPGSPALLDALRSAGHEVLLPVVPAAPGALDWACFDGDLAAGPLGLREPVGPRLGCVAIRGAGLVLVPALAADRAGRRLGRGGGYYDRTLPLAAPGTPLVVVLNDEELVDEVPAEPHDRRVTAALLADAGHVTLGLTTRGNSS